jgi:hypothetical protein
MTFKEIALCRIESLKNEQGRLQISHDQMVRLFQEKITQNQNRFIEIKGAITELEELIKNESYTETHPVDGGDNPRNSGDDLACTRSYPFSSGHIIAGGG